MNLNNQNDKTPKTGNNMNIRGTNPPRAARYPAGRAPQDAKTAQPERTAAPAATHSQTRPVVQGQTSAAPTRQSAPDRKKGLSTLEKILIILLVAVIITAAVITVLTSSRSSDAAVDMKEIEGELADLRKRYSSALEELSALTSEKEELAKKVEMLGLDSDDREAYLTKQIEEKTAEIAALTESIESYKSIYAVDIRTQVELVNELTEIIEEEAPLHNLKEGIDPDVVKVGDLDEDGNEITEKDLYDYPSISVYYEDLATGFRYSYNADKVWFSASVIKAFYITSLLEDVSAAYKAAEDDRVNNDGELVFKDEKFDIEHQTWVLTDAAKKTGSGKLYNMSAGEEFTYLQLIEYSIRDSDNTAFYELRNTFGYDSFYADAARLGVKSINYGFNSLSAQDAGKFLRFVYEFMESDERFGEILKGYLTSTKFNILIPSAVYPTTTAHKYGWDADAYHDAGIVYADKPYVVVVMTDMDEGGDEVNSFIQKIIRKINQMHKNFYG
ncbi:MAG: serine hydrolase [Clostridia bacterium]|nr:serine hydrolase [Clostridia bacterium]